MVSMMKKHIAMHRLPPSQEFNLLCRDVSAPLFFLQTMVICLCYGLLILALELLTHILSAFLALFAGDPFWQNKLIHFSSNILSEAGLFSLLLPAAICAVTRFSLVSKYGRNHSANEATIDLPANQLIDALENFYEDHALDWKIKNNKTGQRFTGRMAESDWSVSFLEVSLIPEGSDCTTLLIRSASCPKDLLLPFSAYFCDFGTSQWYSLSVRDLFSGHISGKRRKRKVVRHCQSSSDLNYTLPPALNLEVYRR